MIREKLIDKGIGDDKKFRWRSHEPSRLEGLSDAVFGFAITLLVVSLEVPRNFAELMQAMRGFGAFAISFTLLFLVWFNQYKFFRRYGLQDNTSVVLNGVLLFVVLFYVYPLKFLFTLLVNIFSGGGGQVRLPDGTTGLMVENGDQVSTLMIIFGAGYVAVFGVFVLLYCARLPAAGSAGIERTGSLRYACRYSGERAECQHRLTLDRNCVHWSRSVRVPVWNDLHA